MSHALNQQYKYSGSETGIHSTFHSPTRRSSLPQPYKSAKCQIVQFVHALFLTLPTWLSISKHVKSEHHPNYRQQARSEQHPSNAHTVSTTLHPGHPICIATSKFVMALSPSLSKATLGKRQHRPNHRAQRSAKFVNSDYQQEELSIYT